MPDRRVHRGPHPDDLKLFAPDTWPLLTTAIDDLCWLLNRGYPTGAARKLVGDRYNLSARQRTAIERCSCSDASIAWRRGRQLTPEAVRGRPLWLDGYNVLTTIEAALSGGVILAGRDGCYRDMASMHGSYRKVVETLPALELIGRTAAELEIGECRWYLDRPVSNSGRLRTILEQVGQRHGWPWHAELVQDPDGLLADSGQIVATADSAILDRCTAWFNLAQETITRYVPDALIPDLGPRVA
jgi:hypothetical protein